MNTRITTGLALLMVSTTAAAQDCPPSPDNPPIECIILQSFQQCYTAEQGTHEISISTDAQLTFSGCGIVSSAGGVLCGAHAVANASGTSSGACGTGNCSESDGAAMLDGDGGDLLQQSISVNCSAGASVWGANASTSASGSVSPTSMSTSYGTASESSRGEDIEVFGGFGAQTTQTSARAKAMGIAGGGFSTVLESGCTSIGFELTIDLDLSTTNTCDMEGEGCSSCSPAGIVFVAFVGWDSVPGVEAPPGSPSSWQGVLGIQRNEDGSLTPIQLGLLDSEDFDILYDGTTLDVTGVSTVLVDLPSGLEQVTLDHDVDSFGPHDGDIDADGVVCEADEILMSGLIGTLLGNPNYTPRADFDLDGTISESDLEQFYLVYAPDLCGCLSADVNGDCCVDIGDFLMVLGEWGDCIDPLGQCDADVDGDGVVGVTDFLLILGAWGTGECSE